MAIQDPAFHGVFRRDELGPISVTGTVSVDEALAALYGDHREHAGRGQARRERHAIRATRMPDGSYEIELQSGHHHGPALVGACLDGRLAPTPTGCRFDGVVHSRGRGWPSLLIVLVTMHSVRLLSDVLDVRGAGPSELAMTSALGMVMLGTLVSMSLWRSTLRLTAVHAQRVRADVVCALTLGPGRRPPGR